MPQYVIIANGPFLHRDIILEAMQGKAVVVLDGALNKLRWCPSERIHCILGDFDSVDSVAQEHWGIKQTYASITETSKSYIGNHNVLIVPAKNQELTDLEKAIEYCDRRGASSITLVCASGGRSDHDVAVKEAMRKAYRPDRVMTLQTEQQSVRYARDEVVSFNGQTGDHCGFIATSPGGHGSSEGLLYTCAGHPESYCNQLTTETATLTVTGEALLFLPPELPSQRAFMLKNDLERLQLLIRDAEANTSPYIQGNFLSSCSATK
jgi:thiamine pyrophosphokinase